MADFCVLAPFRFHDEMKHDDSEPVGGGAGPARVLSSVWPSEPPGGERVRRPKGMWLSDNTSTALTDHEVAEYYRYCLATAPTNLSAAPPPVTAAAAAGVSSA
jgi:hypothetical protein